MRVAALAPVFAFAFGLIAMSRGACAQETPGGSGTVGSSSPSVSSSPPPAADVTARAVVHYESGRAYYASGRYRAAINELETAVQLDPSGYNLYFDLGLVYERVGRVDDAARSYRSYLSHVTDSAERERGERILWRLNGARRELAEIQPHHGVADGWFWTATVLALGGFGAGAGLLLFTAERRPPLSPADASMWNFVGEGALIAGGVFTITAALLYLVRERLPSHTPRCVTAGLRGGFALRF